MEDLTFGEQVKIILGRKGMTIKELAEIIEQRTGKKMSRQNLTQRLGRDNFQEQDMRMIADILGCPFHLSILTNEVQAASAGAVQEILADRAHRAKKQQKKGTGHKVRKTEVSHKTREVEEITEAEPYQMSLFEDVAIQSAVVEEPKESVHEIYQSEEVIEEDMVLEDIAEEPYVAEEPDMADEEADVYQEETSAESDDSDQSYEAEPREDAVVYEEEAEPFEPSYEQEQPEIEAQEEELELIPEDAEEVDMTIGELYDIHEGLTELEKSVEAGEPVEAIKKELEKPGEQIKPKKERFRTGGIFLRKRGAKTQPAAEPVVKEEPVQEEPVIEETVRTSFTETVPVQEEPVKNEPDFDDFEPVIKYDDVDEDREQGEINPYTGREYQSNSVRMHPNRIGYVQVYDRKSHKWTDMTEWAFLGYQERKKALLGKDYEPPIYLD